LRSGCPEFATWWKGHEVHGSAAGIKLVKHPTQGVLRLAHASFQSNDDPSLRLVIYARVSPSCSASKGDDTRINLSFVPFPSRYLLPASGE
jgi:hypothetical protein